MNNWTIGRRIVIGFATTISILVILAVLIRFEFQLIKRSTDIVSVEALPAVETITEMQYLTATNLTRTFQHIYSSSPEEMKNLEAEMTASSKRISELTAGYEKVVHPGAEQEALDRIGKIRVQYRDARNPILNKSRASTTSEERAQLYEEARTVLLPIADAYTDALTALSELEKKNANDAVDEIETTIARRRRQRASRLPRRNQRLARRSFKHGQAQRPERAVRPRAQRSGSSHRRSRRRRHASHGPLH
jgi:methyl-accepting chemotaxis protein